MTHSFTQKRPFIICHMVASIDGRIDCAMVDKISGDEYYTTLDQLHCPSWLNGRVTMEHYQAASAPFETADKTPVGSPSFYVAEAAEGYAISVDTSGKLTWASNRIDGLPLVCIVSEQVPQAYLDYLKQMQISWIACGTTAVDLPQAMECLGTVFHVQRLAVLGGGHINAGFLEAGLIDQISLLLAPGVDGRKGRAVLFDGLKDTPRDPFALKLRSVEAVDNGTVWLQYDVMNK